MKKKIFVIGGIVLFISLFIVLSFTTDTTANTSASLNESENTTESVDLTSWLTDTASDDYVVTVYGASYCSHCQEYKPVITTLSEEKGFKLYFFEIDTFSEEDYNTVTTTYDLENYEGSVPFTVIFKNGKVIADTTGFADEDTTISFLKENKVY